MNQHVKQVPAYLLALVFIFFGFNYFFNFLPTPRDMVGPVAQFFTLFAQETKYMAAIKVLEIVGGLMLLLPRTRAMGLCIIIPIVVNILFFEIFIAKEVTIGAALVVLSALAIFFNKEKFAGILKS